MPKPKRKSRQARFNPTIAEEICRLLATGQSLAAICRRPGMPDRRTVGRWRATIPGFHAEFALAREEGSDLLSHEVLTIADTPQIGDTVEVVGDHLQITRADLLTERQREVASRLRLLAHWNPRPRQPDPIEKLLLEIRRSRYANPPA